MRELFRDNIPLTQLVLRIITGIDDLIIVSEETQYDLNRLLNTKSICLDVLATDSDGESTTLRSDKGASPMRARYHSSAIDTEFLSVNKSFEQLPVTYVIFITEHDTRKSGKPINIYSRCDIDSGDILRDNEYIIYVNGEYNNTDDNSDLAKLIHDFLCNDYNDMYFELMAERTEYYKNTPKGESYMCKLMEDMANERAEKAKQEQLAQIIRMMLNYKKSYAEIVEILHMSVNDVERIAGLAVQLNPAFA